MITSIRELARLANVSRSTVSLALRNSPHLAAATRERIQKLARDEGYRIDPVVVTLMNQLRVSRKVRSIEKLAYLTSWDTRSKWRQSPNDVYYFEGACQRATVLGYEIEEFWAKEPGITQSRLSRILHARGIRGVIIAPTPVARGHFSLNWQYFAASAISETVIKPDLNRSMHYNYRAVLLAMRRLKHHGYKRIGLANLIHQDNLANNAWLAGYLVHRYQHPSADPVEPFLTPTWNKVAFRNWLNQNRPDAVLSNALEVLEMLRDLGQKVPEDIGYARLDLAVEGAPWSGIDQCPREVGAAAVDLVVTQLQNNELGLPIHAKTQMVNGVWRDGPTTLTSRIHTNRLTSKKPAVSKRKTLKSAAV